MKEEYELEIDELQSDELECEKNIMSERGKIVLNGYEFTVQPIFLGEEDEYFSDTAGSPVPVRKNGMSKEPFTDEEISIHIRRLFKNELYDDMKNINKIAPIIKNKLIIWVLKKCSKKHYYKDKRINKTILWMQKKVKYKNKHIKFYDLEREFKLSKAEIGRILIYIHELSGF